MLIFQLFTMENHPPAGAGPEDEVQRGENALVPMFPNPMLDPNLFPFPVAVVQDPAPDPVPEPASIPEVAEVHGPAPFHFLFLGQQQQEQE